MPNLHELENAMPVAPLKIIALPSAEKMGRRINDYMVEFRKSIHNDKVKNDPAFHGYIESNYLVDVDVPRFGSGEAKAQIGETIRGRDLFILTDVCNHSITYNMNGYTNHMSPDDHYQDLKRVIAACNGKARRINVIMPFLYEGRQHRRSGRESLDCAYALEELRDMGIDNFITFDAHDPRVQNSTPLNGFDNFTTPYQFIKSLLNSEDDLIVDKDHLLVISPDEGALDRAIYFASVLCVDTGMFYKRRDYSTIVNGKNPIVAHEYLGDSVEGKDVLIIDDMISAGHARALLAITDSEKQYTIAMKVFDEKLSVRETEKLIKNLDKQVKPKVNTTPENDFIYRDIENKLKESMGTKVIIHNKDNNKGKIEIEYYSQDDFERIVDILKK